MQETLPTEARVKTTYYWASWKRVLMVAVPLGLLMLVASYVGAGENSLADHLRIIITVACATVALAVLLGTTFFRIKNRRLFYITSLFEWHRMEIEEIERIVLVPRFFFTNKVTAVQIERKDPGIFPGMLISRDAFPDPTITALVSHLKQINPGIEIDEGVQKILESQEAG